MPSLWQALPMSNVVQKFTLAGWDMRFLAWIDAGVVTLKAGRNEIRFRFGGQPKPHGMLDCFVFTREPFTPFGVAKPDEAAKLWRQQAEDEANWFHFNPPQATFAAASAIDLRFLNEKVAGENGRIQARDGKLIHATSGETVRFWAVNGPPHDLKGDALKAHVR